jgi:hypothetical protein
MKRIGVAALVTLLVLGAVTTGARANHGVFATWWDANDTKDNGLGIGFRSKVPIAPLVSFDTRISWIRFSDDDINLFPMEATGMLKLGMLYGGAGVGYYIFNGANLKNSFGWYALGGIDIGVKSFGIFAEAKWNSLSADPETADPDAGNAAPASVDAGGIAVNLGVMFGVPKL